MSKVFLHLGAHKTATTFIQDNFIANRAALEQQGWKLLHPESDNPVVRKCFIEMRKDNLLQPEDEKYLDEFFAGIRKGAENFFLSSEAILGAMSVRGMGRIYPNHASALEKILGQLNGKDTAIGFCIRDFSDYLESSYSWLVMRGATYDFEAYSKNVTVEKMSWLPIIENMVEALGEDRVHIWTYEDFRKNPAAFVTALMDAATIDSSRLEIAVKEPRNVSAPPDTVALGMMWNRILKVRKKMPKSRKHALRMEMQKLLAKSHRPASMKRPLSKERRAELRAHYQTELGLMRARWPKAMLSLPQ